MVCGLFGIIANRETDFSSQQAKAMTKLFRALAQVSTIRGVDGTGVLEITQGRGSLQYDLNKSMHDAVTMFSYGDMWGWSASEKTKVLMGHVRAATQGKISDATAHPFLVGGVVLAHNGTLYGPDEINKFDVDSQWIADTMDKSGPQEIINSAVGAYSLTWYNLEDSTFHMLRNSGRPMWLCSVGNGAAIVYASMPEIISLACAHAGIKIDGGYDEIRSTKEMTLYTWESDLTPEIKTMSRQYRSFLPTNYAANKKSQSGKVDFSRQFLEYFDGKDVVCDYKYVTNTSPMTIICSYPEVYHRKFDCLPRRVFLRGLWKHDRRLVHGDRITGRIYGYDAGTDQVTLLMTDCELANEIEAVSYEVSIEEMLEAEQLAREKALGVTMHPGPGGVYLPTNEYMRLISQGCVGCGAALEDALPDDVQWDIDGFPHCAACYEDDMLLESDVEYESRILQS